MQNNAPRELALPEEVIKGSNVQEFIRFWVVDGIDYVTLNINGFEDNSEEPKYWGSILADIAWHAVNGMKDADPASGSSKVMMENLKLGFAGRLASKQELSGGLKDKPKDC